jgi:predicted enzyme related to lactoylglutathione lyase
MPEQQMRAPPRCSAKTSPLLSLALGAWLAMTLGCASTSKPDLSGMSFSSEPLVGKIVWNDLVTEDLERSQQFYGGLFGWTFEQTTGPGGRPYLLARAGRRYVAGLVAVQPRMDGRKVSRWLPYVSVSEVDASVRRAVSSGATVVVPARDVNLGRVAVIDDPEGAVIGLARSRIGDPDDATTAAGIGRVVWTELLANDPDAATRFYAAVIGWQPHVVQRHGGEYTRLTYRDTDRAGILKNPSDDAAPAWLTYFGVDDPVAAAKRVEELGGTVVLRPSAQLRDGTIAVVTDPAGALLVLQKLSR